MLRNQVFYLEVLQQIRERMEAIAKGVVSDHWSLHCIYDSNQIFFILGYKTI